MEQTVFDQLGRGLALLGVGLLVLSAAIAWMECKWQGARRGNH